MALPRMVYSLGWSPPCRRREELRGTMVESPDAWPGEADNQVDELITTWSNAAPSSRVCTRRVCVPVEPNVMGDFVSQYAPSCHPHPEVPQLEQFSRFTRRPDSC